MSKTVTLTGLVQREYAKMLIDQAPDGYVVKIAEETRRDAQNRKLHALIGDIRKQNEEMAAYSVEDIKLRFMNALGVEMRFLPALEGAGMFPIGQRTSTLTVQQFSALVELLYEWGARNGVRWTESMRKAA